MAPRLPRHCIGTIRYCFRNSHLKLRCNQFGGRLVADHDPSAPGQGPGGRVPCGSRAATVEPMTVKRMDHVGIVVGDLEAAKAFFAELGFGLQGAGSAEGEWVDRIVGLDSIEVEFAMMETPDGHSRLELIEFQAPAGADGDPQAPANTPGIRHLAIVVEDRSPSTAASGLSLLRPTPSRPIAASSVSRSASISVQSSASAGPNSESSSLLPRSRRARSTSAVAPARWFLR